jgi:hypothetical protein
MGGPPGPIPISHISYLGKVQERLIKNGFNMLSARILHTDVVGGIKSEFEWIRIRTVGNCVIMGHAAEITLSAIQGFTFASYRVARASMSGGMPFVHCFAILSSAKVDEMAKTWVTVRRPKLNFSGVEVPMIHDSKANQVIYYPRIPMYAWYVYANIQEFISTYLRP